MMMTRSIGVCQSAVGRKTLILLAILLLSACSESSNNVLQNESSASKGKSWSASGMVAISRVAPQVAGTRAQMAMGFVPAALQGTPTGSWLSISLDDSTIRLMKNDQVVYSLKGEGFKQLSPGLYKVKHKQRSPLWYAPDSYFQERNLQPPAEGDKSRFRRGALGDFVIFIDQDTPIHSGPIWLPAIGGVKMDEADLSKIYYSLEVGSTIEIK